MSFLDTIGAGAGFLIGGPAGAAVGSAAGGVVGSLLSNSGSDPMADLKSSQIDSFMKMVGFQNFTSELNSAQAMATAVFEAKQSDTRAIKEVMTALTSLEKDLSQDIGRA